MPKEITTEDRHEFLRLRDDTRTHGVLALIGTDIIGYIDHDLSGRLGYDPQELEGKPLGRLLPERVQDGHEQDVAGFVASGDKRARTMKHHDGTIAAIHKRRNPDGSKRFLPLLSTIHVVRGHPCVFVLDPATWRATIVNQLGERT